jgi:hypothetical protein
MKTHFIYDLSCSGTAQAGQKATFSIYWSVQGPFNLIEVTQSTTTLEWILHHRTSPDGK